MALSPTREAKKQGDAPCTQETEDDKNGCLRWFWECIGWRSSQDTLERRLNPSNRLSFGYVGTSQSPVLSPGLIDWHSEKNHKGEGSYAATGQGEGPRDTTTTITLALHVTKQPKVLSILRWEPGGYVKAFVQSEEQGMTKQWAQLYSLAESRELGDALVVLEDFRMIFSQKCL